MEHKRFSLITIASWVVGGILVVGLGVFLIVGLRAGRLSSRQRLEENNRTLLSLSSELMVDPLYESDHLKLERMLSQLVGKVNAVRAEVRDETGESIVEAAIEDFDPALDEHVGRDLAAQALASGDIVQQESRNYLVLCGPIATSTDQLGTLEIVIDLTPFWASFRPMIVQMVLTIVAVVAGGVLTTALLTRRATSSLKELGAAAEAIGRGNLDTSIPIRGSSEVVALGQALDRMRRAFQELYGDLERQMAVEAKRARHLQAAADVSHSAAVELDVPALMERVVTLIDERFDFSRQGIFLMDDTGEWAVLHAASGATVGETLEQDFRLRVGEEGTVGHVAETGEAYVAQDVIDDPFFVHDTDRVDVRAEAALPLRARGEIIGVLDVQSTEVDAFTESDVTVLQTMADQVAMAISNTRLYQQAQENLERVQRAYGDLSREAWAEILRARAELSYYCDAEGVFSAGSRQMDEAQEDLPEFSIPVVVRDQVIGTVKAHKSPDDTHWSKEETSLLEALTEQLGAALESARLYQSTQRRAARERLTREITDQMRRASTVEGIVQTALDELYKALGTSRTFARLGSEDASQRDGNGRDD